MTPIQEEMIAYADARNRERGRKVLLWLRLKSEDDPNHLVGLDPDNDAIVGPNIWCGRQYKIKYAEPMILPFYIQAEEVGDAVLHVAEIEGTLDSSGTRLLNVKLVFYKPDDYSIKRTGESDISILRLSVDDEIEEV